MSLPAGLVMTQARLRNILPFCEDAVLDLEPGLTMISGFVAEEKTSLFLALLQALEGQPRAGHPDMFPEDGPGLAVLTLSDGTAILRTGKEFRFLSNAALSCGAGEVHGQGVLIPPEPAVPRRELQALLVDFNELSRSGPVSSTKLIQKALGEEPNDLPIVFLRDIFAPRDDVLEFMLAGMNAIDLGWQMVASAGDMNMNFTYCFLGGPSSCLYTIYFHVKAATKQRAEEWPRHPSGVWTDPARTTARDLHKGTFSGRARVYSMEQATSRPPRAPKRFFAVFAPLDECSHIC